MSNLITQTVHTDIDCIITTLCPKKYTTSIFIIFSAILRGPNFNFGIWRSALFGVVLLLTDSVMCHCAVLKRNVARITTTQSRSLRTCATS